MPPENVCGRLRAVGDDAGEVHGAALLQVDVRSAQDLGVRLGHHQVHHVRRRRRRRDLALVLARVAVPNGLNLRKDFLSFRFIFSLFDINVYILCIVPLGDSPLRRSCGSHGSARRECKSTALSSAAACPDGAATIPEIE